MELTTGSITLVLCCGTTPSVRRLINEARFNVSRWYFNELTSNPQEPWGLPQGTITGLPGDVIVSSHFGANGPGIFYKTGYNIRDTVTKVLNRHSLKFGVDIYKEQNTQTQGGARAQPTTSITFGISPTMPLSWKTATSILLPECPLR